MKVLLINGSCHDKGCTNRALKEVEKILISEGIETEIINLGSAPLRDCLGCQACKKLNNRCAFDDDIVNKILVQAENADGFIFGTPVYFAHPSGRIISLMDRLFYSGKKLFEYKPAFALASARRAGTTASLDVLNKYFAFSCMPIVPSNYWNMVHGNSPLDVEKDLEGLQIIRNAALNMSWMLKLIENGKNLNINHPELPEKIWTNFVR